MGATLIFMMRRLICQRGPGVNLRPAFAKYCFTRLYTIFYLLLAINIKTHKGVMFSSILLQNDNKFQGL